MKQVKMGGEARHTEVAMRALGDALVKLLPAGMGFTLFVFDFNEPGQEGGHVSYISNAARPTMLATVRAWLKSQGGRDS